MHRGHKLAPAPAAVGDDSVMVAVDIVALMVSPVHAYEGRPADGPRPDPEPIGRQSVEVRAELGLVGDRYFAHEAHRDAAVTMIAIESLEALGLPGTVDPLAARRNIVLRGFAVDDLAASRQRDGVRFSLDTGSGPIRFQANRPANPCAWMDIAVGPGAFRGLRGRGGVRCTPLGDGTLSVGAAQLTILD